MRICLGKQLLNKPANRADVILWYVYCSFFVMC